MAQETKVGLLIGLALILLVGLVLSDLFTSGPEEAEGVDAHTDFGREAQAGIYAEPPAHANPDISERRPYDSAGSMFQAEPAPAYRAPRETTSPIETTSPNHRARPDLPELDTLEARDDDTALVRQSLEAMRLMPSVADADATLPDDTSAATVPTQSPETQNRAADLAPFASRVDPPAPVSTSGGTVFFHRVVAGQTLTDIAQQHYGNPDFARAIALANPATLDAEGQVRVGTRLEIPPLGSPVFNQMFEPAPHAVRATDGVPPLPSRPEPRVQASARSLPTMADAGTTEILVQPGDTLSELAAEHLGSGSRWDELLAANRDRLNSAEGLRSGMKLRIPQNAEAPQASETITTREAARPAARTADRESSDGETYTVKPGDNLTRIAAKLLGDGERWDELLEANAHQLDRPENLRVGMKLTLPGTAATPEPVRERVAAASPRPTPSAETYTVQAGDNLTRIAANVLGDGSRWRELFEANTDQLSSPDALAAGQTLRLP